MIDVLRRGWRAAFARAPWLRSSALRAVDTVMRPALFPFQLRPPHADAARGRAIADETDAFNRSAETYYAEHADRRQLLDKPFSEPASLARRLIDVGSLIDGLRLQPGDIVLDIGAGACWLSHLLNRFGCPTIALDVSPTALAIGRQLFEEDRKTNWSLQPQFLAYDGRSIPLPDASVDRVVLFDAYHHLPNPAELMPEMRRVLRQDGIVAMSEPGRGHADSAPSVAEAAATGVLENELVLEDIAALAIASGFRAARVLVSPNAPLMELDATDLRRFTGGRGFSRYWKELCAALDSHHYILLFAGDPEPTTARPKRLRAMIRETAGRQCLTAMRGVATDIVIDVHNNGDTRWIADEGTPGWTRLGGHLYEAEPRRLVDFDWVRIPLGSDVRPDRTIRISASLPPIERPGDYVVALDLVIEAVAWFADRGSPTLELRCVVTATDCRR